MTSIGYLVAAMVGGLLLGPFAESLLAGLLPRRFGAMIAQANVQKALQKSDYWTLHEKEGRRYEFQPLSEGDEADQLVTADDRMFEDVGLMGHCEAGGSRVAFGLTWDEHRAITSPLAATIAEEYGRKDTNAALADARLMTDGGEEATDGGTQSLMRDDLSAQELVGEIRQKALLSRAFEGGHIVETVNAAVGIPRARIADARKTENLLAHAGDPEQPARTASNAENAERARSGPDSLFDKVKGGLYYMMGLLTAYVFLEVLASSGGGGGGGVPGPNPTGMIDAGLLMDVVTAGVL